MTASMALCLLVLFVSTISAENVPNAGITVDIDMLMKMQERLAYLEERDRVYRSEIDSLRLQTRTQQLQIDRLQQREKDFEIIAEANKENLDKIDHMKEHIALQDERIAALEEKLRAAKGPSKILSTEAKTDEVSSITPAARENPKHPRAATEEGMVGFSATLSKSLSNLGANQDIAFDHVITNVGNAYHAGLGVFVAPVDGLYVFSFTVIAHNEDHHVNLVVNGQKQTGLFVRALESVFDTSSLTVVLLLNENDDVSVKNLEPNDNIHVGSAFSGFLVHPSFGSSPIVGK